MVYGRYNELVNGDDFMVYKPTFTSLGGPILWRFPEMGGTPIARCMGYFMENPNLLGGSFHLVSGL